MSKVICEKQDLVDIANAIRAKNGKTNEFSIYQMPNEITSISGTQLPTLSNSGASGDLAYGKQLIDADGNVVTGTFTIDSELSTQDGLISQIQSVVSELPEVSDLEPVLQEKTVTPTTSPQNVTPDSGFDGLSKVMVNGDANLKAENIAEGVSIFGVTGTHSGGSGGSSSGSIATSAIRLLAAPGVTSQTMQVIASVYENNAIATVNKTVDVYFYVEDGMGSVSNTLNVINNTPVTLIFSQVAPSAPIATVGDATFICNDGKTISFTFTPDADTNMCNIRL